jgi:hypothetical protein
VEEAAAAYDLLHDSHLPIAEREVLLHVDKYLTAARVLFSACVAQHIRCAEWSGGFVTT